MLTVNVGSLGFVSNFIQNSIDLERMNNIKLLLYVYVPVL